MEWPVILEDLGLLTHETQSLKVLCQATLRLFLKQACHTISVTTQATSIILETLLSLGTLARIQITYMEIQTVHILVAVRKEPVK